MVDINFWWISCFYSCIYTLTKCCLLFSFRWFLHWNNLFILCAICHFPMIYLSISWLFYSTKSYIGISRSFPLCINAFFFICLICTSLIVFCQVHLYSLFPKSWFFLYKTPLTEEIKRSICLLLCHRFLCQWCKIYIQLQEVCPDKIMNCMKMGLLWRQINIVYHKSSAAYSQKLCLQNGNEVWCIYIEIVSNNIFSHEQIILYLTNWSSTWLRRL